LLAINGMPDHNHILAVIKPTQSLSDLFKNLREDSSK